MDRLFYLAFLVGLTVVVHASHFRGGTISWKPLNHTQVLFNFKMGWVYGRGPGCTEDTIGQMTTRKMGKFNCQVGCKDRFIEVGSVDYYCMAASKIERWEQGENKFNYTFPHIGQYSVGFHGNAWMVLSKGGAGDWNIFTTIDLRTRSDIGRINSSPYTLSKALYTTQHGCNATIKLPVLDPDGDRIRCRWAVNEECKSICNSLPNAVLDEERCILSFDPSKGFKKGGFYAVAVTIEDFPRTQITLSDDTANSTVIKTPADALSSIPVQFLINTPGSPTPCEWEPQFVSPTPKEDEMVVVTEGKTANITLAADNGVVTTVGISDIQVIGSKNLKTSKLQIDSSRVNTFYKTITWLTEQSDIGEHIICANPIDKNQKSGDESCFTLKIDADDCKSTVCQHGGTCLDLVDDYVCICPPGSTGKNCQDFDDCISSPCPNGQACVDQVGGYICVCSAGKTKNNTEKDSGFCLKSSCKNSGNCINGLNGYTCICKDGWHGMFCDKRNSLLGKGINKVIVNVSGDGTVKPNSDVHPKNNGSGDVIVKLNSDVQSKERITPKENGSCPCHHSAHDNDTPIGNEQLVKNLLMGFFGFLIGVAFGLSVYFLARRCVERYDSSNKLRGETTSAVDRRSPTEAWTKGPLTKSADIQIAAPPHGHKVPPRVHKVSPPPSYNSDDFSPPSYKSTKFGRPSRQISQDMPLVDW